MSKPAMLMRLWKAEITHNGHVVFTRDIAGQGASEALDEAWRLFDPDKAISLFDASYSSSAEKL